ncbi:MAG TPA: GNAT family protein [Frankiaceae bacterium]|nr:GNAT family protein [Frankiaceae bacterium]
MIPGDVVTLRPLRPDDLELLWQWRIDLATWGDQTDEAPYPMTLEAYRRGHEEAPLTPGRGITWAVEVNGELVGRAALFAFDELSRNAEVGLGFGPEHRGKGYGRETLRLLLDFCFRRRNLHRVWLECAATNERAIRAYRAAGFVEEGRLREHAWIDGRYVDMVRMAVLRSEWAP